jgi:O-antigen/teichoic acid export membrane protein
LNPLKKLAGQTAIYGVGTILARVLNYFLLPLYTSIFAPAVFAQYNKAYAYIAILLVILTYGMETAIFNFSNKREDKAEVFSTVMGSILTTTSLFWVLIFSFAGSIAHFMQYPGHTDYVIWLGLIIGLDAISAIPMAWLRQQNRPKVFTGITLLNILINIGLNLFWLLYCRNLFLDGKVEPGSFVDRVYNHDIGVGYIFISNLIASAIKMVCCFPIMLRIPFRFNRSLLKQMLVYALPLVISGLGFIINERLDILLLERLLPLPKDQADIQIGIYGGCYKLAILMTLFIQAYRFAAEPFFFSQLKEKEPKRTYAKVMNYFVMLCCFLFLIVNLYLDIFKYFIANKEFWVGLKIVPIIMMANLFLGIYINLSMWYKLSGQTMFGVWFSVIGAIVTIVLNVIFIPTYGYMASAWTTLAAYFTMCLISYLIGRKYYPIPYNLKKILTLILVSLGLSYISMRIPFDNMVVKFLINTALLSFFLFVVYNMDAKLREAVLTFRKKYGRKN